jgi:hypothetical protein
VHREVEVGLWTTDRRPGRLRKARDVRPFPAVAAQQCGVFSTRQAALEGWTRSAIRHASRTGRLVTLRPGAHQIADLGAVAPGLSAFEEARWRHAAAGIAAALTTTSVASHSTAAVLHGLPLLFLPPLACVCVLPYWTGRMTGVHLHRCALSPWPDDAVGRTSVERVVVDLAREHGRLAGLVAADFALHEGRTTLPDLLTELEVCRRWPGVQSAREAVAFADGRSESVLETRSRLAIEDWGLPAPEPQAVIGDGWGGFVARVDFYWDEFGVVGEVDGDVKYGGTDPTPLLEEKRRERRLDDLELPVVRWGASDLREFGAVAARLRRAFARGGQTPRAARRWTVLPRL